MTPIYKAFLCALFLGFAADSLAANPEAPGAILERLLVGERAFDGCFAVGKRIACAKGKNFPGTATNPQARQAVLNGLAITARAALYNFLSGRAKAGNLRNENAVGRAVQKGQSDGAINLKGIKFASLCRGERCGAVAIAPLEASLKELRDIYETPEFITAYCRTLYPEASALMSEGKYGEALIRLKELHDLKFANVDAYLLACRAFIRENQPTEAEKIARELLADFAANLNADQAEELGDLFAALSRDGEAEKAYVLAGELLGVATR